MALSEGEGCTHKDEVSEAKLHSPEHAQDDSHYVEEVGQDGSPLVAQEVKHLPLEGCHLGDEGEGGAVGVSHNHRDFRHTGVGKYSAHAPLHTRTKGFTHTVTGTHTHTGLPQLFPW